MVGTKGKSGGSRPGAGRPVERFTLKREGKYLLTTKTPDGWLPMQLATVVEVDRAAIVFELDNGDRLTLRR